MKALNGGQQDLLPAGERIDQPPQWFRDALDNAPQDHFVAYQHTNLHYRQWRGPSADTPNIVLVHGGGAHARWYDFIAPFDPLLQRHFGRPAGYGRQRLAAEI